VLARRALYPYRSKPVTTVTAAPALVEWTWIEATFTGCPTTVATTRTCSVSTSAIEAEVSFQGQDSSG